MLALGSRMLSGSARHYLDDGAVDVDNRATGWLGLRLRTFARLWGPESARSACLKLQRGRGLSRRTTLEQFAEEAGAAQQGIHDDIYASFIDKLTQAVSRITLDDPMSDSTCLSCLINQK